MKKGSSSAMHEYRKPIITFFDDEYSNLDILTVSTGWGDAIDPNKELDLSGDDFGG